MNFEEEKEKFDKLIDKVSPEELLKQLKEFGYNPDELNQTSQSYQYLRGWVCPKCGSVYGPSQNECYRCNPPYVPTITC